MSMKEINDLGDLFASSMKHDVEIRPCSTDPLVMASKDPFNYHLFCSFILKDEVMGSPETLQVDYFDPAATELARQLNRLQIVEACVLPLCDPRTAQQENFTASGLPFRVTAEYDICSCGLRVTVDMLVRHVGNYYRTIIHGPLHRLAMPFKRDPEKLQDGLFNYLHIPLKRPDYYTSDEGTGEETLLPGLTDSMLHPEIIHHYRVKGDYCYYTGETYQ